MARSSMGRLMPAMTSTCPGSVSALQQLDGVPPLMSVMTSTPSPSSTRLIASFASTLTCERSWSGCTSIASKWSVGPRITCSTACTKAWPSGAWVIRRMPTICLSVHFLFDGVDEHRRDVEARLVRDLLEAGRAGDVHLGEVIADHVQSYQQQAAGCQQGSQRTGDFAVALRQRLGDAGAPGGQVAAHFARLRDARERERHRFAANDEHPLVALDDVRDIALGHDGARAVLGQRLDHGAGIFRVKDDGMNLG